MSGIREARIHFQKLLMTLVSPKLYELIPAKAIDSFSEENQENLTEIGKNEQRPLV